MEEAGEIVEEEKSSWGCGSSAAASGCFAGFTVEFKGENLRFIPPGNHYTRFWMTSSRLSLGGVFVWRFLMFGFFLFVFVRELTISIINGELKPRVIYLTEWTATLHLIYWSCLTVWTAVVFGRLLCGSANGKAGGGFEFFDAQDNPTIPGWLKLVWFLCGLVTTSTVIIAVLFWTCLYDGQRVTAEVLTDHFINACACSLDLFISRIPYRICHGVYVYVYATIYLVWSVIFYLCDIDNPFGTDGVIYPILDYSTSEGIRASVAYLSLSYFLLIPSAILFLWWLVHMRPKDPDMPANEPHQHPAGA